MIAENGQGKTDFYDYLDRCCQLISEAYGKSNRAEWTNGDYVGLSSTLFRVTKVQISPNTLKRIFGKIKTDSRYYPQKATRDALVSYIGYSDWEQFVQVQASTKQDAESKPIELFENPVSILPTTPAGQSVSYRNKLLLALTGLALLAILVVVLVNLSTETDVSAQLICRNPLGENPHSAVFDLRRPTTDHADIYQILFGDGKKRIMAPADSVYTHYYEQPGRFFAVLQRNGQPVDTATIYLPTKGWTATASMMHDSSRVYPIETPNLFANGRRSVSAPEAAHAGVDTNRTFFIEFINSQLTHIDGDNFELTTFVKTSSNRAGVRCSQVGVTVWGESSQHSFDVMKPGCVHWTELQTSDVYTSGQHDDLSFLGADLSAGGTLKLEVIDKYARIFINNRKVYEVRYTKPLKQIYGVNILFAGIGKINSFRLKDLKTGAVFAGSF